MTAAALHPSRSAPVRGIDWTVSEDFGHLRQRRDGRWYVDLGRYGRIYSSKGAKFKRSRDAGHVLSAIRAVIAEGTDKRQAIDRWLPTTSAVHRVDRWLAIWLKRKTEQEKAGERSAEYVSELRRWCARDGKHAHLAEFWGRRSVHEIDYQGLETWCGWLEKRGLSAKTRHNVVAAMSAFLGWLRLVKQIQAVPPIPWPRVAEHAPRLLTPAAQARVLAAIPEGARGIFLSLALLGLRPSEAIRLRASDYQPGEPGWLTITRTKNGQVKRLPVPSELADWIAEHGKLDALQGAAPLFRLPYAGRGKYPTGAWNPTSLRRVWAIACRETGASASLYEGTKHSRATDLLRQGVPERVLQAILGHRDVRSTRRYARLADQAVVEALWSRRSSGSESLVGSSKGSQKRLAKSND